MVTKVYNSTFICYFLNISVRKCSRLVLWINFCMIIYIKKNICYKIRIFLFGMNALTFRFIWQTQVYFKCNNENSSAFFYVKNGTFVPQYNSCLNMLILCVINIRANPPEFFERLLTTIYRQKKITLRIDDKITQKLKSYISGVILI